MRERVLLINPIRKYLANEFGFGYQVPLGLVFIGGPLVDSGFDVKIIDADVKKMSDDELLSEIEQFNPKYIGISHTGSTASHPFVVKTVKKIKNRFKDKLIIYGGVYPTFAYRSIINDVKEIDFIVRGEGEETAVELFDALRSNKELEDVKGIVWRKNSKAVVNKPRPPIKDLDEYRPGWELVDWDDYKLLGKRSAGVQFGRGCPNFCDFCGQWIFWKKWRHRSTKSFVDQIEYLVKNHGVQSIWPADEHFAADKNLLKEILEDLASRDFRVSLSINTSVEAILRDKDIMPLYKKAGVDFAAIGVESDSDEVMDEHGDSKSTFKESCEAVKILKENHIIACTNVIYGLEEESFKTMFRKCIKLIKMDPDFLNAMYLTPHFWTKAGAKTDPQSVIQSDLSKWDYRHQILSVPGLSALQLFIGVKFTEFLLHSRPKRLWRGIRYEKHARWMSMYGLWKAFFVWLHEIIEHRKVTVCAPGNLADNQPEKLKLLLPHIQTVNVVVESYVEPAVVYAEA